MSKPIKKNTKELFELIELKIKERNYIFVSHAQDRLDERKVLDTDVLNILLGKPGRNRKRVEAKDKYEDINAFQKANDWKYCIEGNDSDDKKVRIIVTFDGSLMPIITVIRLKR